MITLSKAKIDATRSVIEARINDQLMVIPTKGGIRKKMVISLKTDIIKTVGESSNTGAAADFEVEAHWSPSRFGTTQLKNQVLLLVISRVLRE